MMKVSILLFAFALSFCAGQKDLPVETGRYEMSPYNPAFVKVIPQQNNLNYYLGYSSFSSRSVPDSILYLEPGVTGSLTDGNSNSTVTTEATNWPNEVDHVPDDVFPGFYTWSIAAGFFFGQAQYGGLYIQDMTDIENPADPVMISGEGETELWYYHHVEWIDMDRDGDKDALTVRAYGTGELTELIWFENPNLPYISPNWKGHVLAEKLDIMFCMAELPNPDGSKTTAVIGAGFWGMELTVTWSSTDDWTDLSSIEQITIDSMEFFFSCEFNDINNDGKSEILLTTWSQPDGYLGLVLAYEVPVNWQYDDWLSMRHTLSSDFKVFAQDGKGSPGTAISFHPRTSETDKKRYIAVSGDDDGTAYMMLPNSEDVNDWSYTKIEIYSPRFETTVGQIAIDDVNEDGYADLFIPSYGLGLIICMSYGP